MYIAAGCSKTAGILIHREKADDLSDVKICRFLAQK